MNKPKLRFKGFTEDWEQRKLGDIASDMVAGGDIDKDLILAEGQYPVIANALTGDGIVGYYDKEYRVSAPAVTVTGRGDVGHAKARLVNFTPVVRLLSVKSEHDVFFLENAINTLKIVIESTGVPQLTVPQLAKYEVAFPRQLDEEEHIGAFFKQLDHFITLHQRKCDETQKLKKYMLQKMFPKNGATVPEIRFSGFTEDWEQRKFSDVIDIGSGMDYKHLEEGDIPVYGTGGYMLSVNKALSDAKDAIGIGRKGTIDKPYILRAPFWTVDTLFYCIPKENYDLDFTSCIFQNVDWKKKDESTGVPSLSKVIINNVETATPTFDEQKKIGNYFRSLHHLITLHQRKKRRIYTTLTIVWEQRKLGEVFKEYSEKNHTELPALTIIQGGGTVKREESDRNLMYDESNLSNYKMVRKDDFIVHLRSFEGGLEKSLLDGIISPAYHTFHSDVADSRFYYPYFRSHEFIKHKLVPHVYGIRDGRSIDIAGMKTIEIPYTSIEEQRKIGDYLESLDHLITLHQRKCKELQNMKKFMLQNMFV